MEDKGVPSSKLKKIDLLNIAISVGLAPVEELKKMDKDTLLSIVQEWETKKIAEAEAKDLAKSVASEEVEPWAMGYHNGKKIVKVEEKVVNEKVYDEITTIEGSVYLELKA